MKSKKGLQSAVHGWINHPSTAELRPKLEYAYYTLQSYSLHSKFSWFAKVPDNSLAFAVWQDLKLFLVDMDIQRCILGEGEAPFPSVQNSATFPMLLLKSSKKVEFLSEISSK